MWECGGIAPLILNVGTRGERSASHPGRFNPLKKRPVPIVGPGAGLKTLNEKEMSSA